MNNNFEPSLDREVEEVSRDALHGAQFVWLTILPSAANGRGSEATDRSSDCNAGWVSRRPAVASNQFLAAAIGAQEDEWVRHNFASESRVGGLQESFHVLCGGRLVWREPHTPPVRF